MSRTRMYPSCAALDNIYIFESFHLFKLRGLTLSDELKKTREAIRKKGATWKAEKTSMSELSPEERRKRLGLLPTEEELEELKKKGLGFEKR